MAVKIKIILLLLILLTAACSPGDGSEVNNNTENRKKTISIEEISDDKCSTEETPFLIIDEEQYFINEEIVIYLYNCSKNMVNTEQGFKLLKNHEGVWGEIPYPFGFDTLEYELGPYEVLTQTVRFKNLESGLYKITKAVTVISKRLVLESEFNISE
jgi:hypothetical protein